VGYAALNAPVSGLSLGAQPRDLQYPSDLNRLSTKGAFLKGTGFQPVHKCIRMNAALAADGCIFSPSALSCAAVPSVRGLLKGRANCRSLGFAPDDKIEGGHLLEDSLVESREMYTRAFSCWAFLQPLKTDVDRSLNLMVRESEGKSFGIPHLAKNERDVGHPSFVSGQRTRRSYWLRLLGNPTHLIGEGCVAFPLNW
jgi:hypothetical protein